MLQAGSGVLRCRVDKQTDQMLLLLFAGHYRHHHRYHNQHQRTMTTDAVKSEELSNDAKGLPQGSSGENLGYPKNCNVLAPILHLHGVGLCEFERPF